VFYDQRDPTTPGTGNIYNAQVNVGRKDHAYPAPSAKLQLEYATLTVNVPEEVVTEKRYRCQERRSPDE
jgi:hypothetical protein